jgi:F-type H+-transporting ATPase subunit a
MKRIFHCFLLTFFALTAFFAQASNEKSEQFEPGTFMLDHIMDSYGWHITTYKDKDISVPLPIILFNWNEKSFHCFSSAKFHHGHKAYQGYALGFTENTKHKIVKLKGEYAEYSGEIHKEMLSAIDENVTLLDISITKNVCALLVSIVLIVCLFIAMAKHYKKRETQAPKGIFILLEIIINFIRDDIAKPSIGEKKYQKYLPYLLTLFFFIFLNNLMGLIPIFPFGANLTGNIAVTAVLALLTFIITQFSTNKRFWAHIFNTPGAPWWLKIPLPLMPLVELIGIFTKPFVLMIRLFANITGGHIIVLGFICLIFILGEMNPAVGFGTSVISIFFYIFMSLLELIVAFVQAFVFTLLTSLYIGMACEEGHHEEKMKGENKLELEQKSY